MSLHVLHAMHSICPTWHAQNLKPHNDESYESNNDSEFDAFAEELNSNWYDLIAYD